MNSRPSQASTFTVTAAEAGLAVRVLARFKDGEGAFETVVSNADEAATRTNWRSSRSTVQHHDRHMRDDFDNRHATERLISSSDLGGDDTLVGLANDDISSTATQIMLIRPYSVGAAR